MHAGCSGRDYTELQPQLRCTLTAVEVTTQNRLPVGWFCLVTWLTPSPLPVLSHLVAIYSQQIEKISGEGSADCGHPDEEHKSLTCSPRANRTCTGLFAGFEVTLDDTLRPSVRGTVYSGFKSESDSYKLRQRCTRKLICRTPRTAQLHPHARQAFLCCC